MQNINVAMIVLCHLVNQKFRIKISARKAGKLVGNVKGEGVGEPGECPG